MWQKKVTIIEMFSHSNQLINHYVFFFQMKTLRTLMTSGDHPKPLVDNFRPVQALNGRTIRKRDTADSGHQAFVASPVAIVVLLVAKYLL